MLPIDKIGTMSLTDSNGLVELVYPYERVNPHDFVSQLSEHKDTLQKLTTNYGYIRPSDVSSPEGLPFAIGTGLVEFPALKTLDIEFMALFGPEEHITSSGEKVVGPFLPRSLQSLTLRWIPLEAKVEYLRSIIEHKKHNPSMEMHLDFYCNWSDLGVDEETGERDDSKSKIDKDLRDLADEYGVKIGCAGGELWRREVN
jgi:hypothetical protein